MSEVVIYNQRKIADVTRDIRVKTGQFLLDAIEIGRLLLEAKSMVEPGGWMQYVEDELPFSHSWANNYMRLYKEYGGEQLSIFGNSQATAKLSPTQALELLALPSQEREEFMETHDVENMSTRELKQAIRERDAAQQAQQEAEEARYAAEKDAEAAMEKVGTARDRADKLQSELEEAKAARESASAEVEKLMAKLKKAQDKQKAAEAALAAAKEKPEIPESVMEQMRQQVAADAAKEATESLQKQLDAAVAAEANAEKAKREAEQKLEAAQKALKLANPEVAVLQEMTRRLLNEFNTVHKQLLQVQQSEPETGEKLRVAILGTIDQMRSLLAGNA